VVWNKLFVNHCHVFPKKSDSPGELGIIGTLDKLVDTMKKCRINKAVAFAPFEEQGWTQSIKRDANDWLAEELPSYHEIVGFACINPKSPKSLEKLEKAWRKGLLGVKLHPPIQEFRPNDEKIFEFYLKAQELGMILDFHTGTHGWRLLEYQPLLIDDVAYAFPKLNIVIEHVGGRYFYNQAMALMADKKNVYAGISSCLDEKANKSWFLGAEKIEEIDALIGGERIIYGTDFPYNDWKRILKDVEIIKNSNLTESTKEKTLGGNLERLIKTVPQH